jgi:hypothetical protein
VYIYTKFKIYAFLNIILYYITENQLQSGQISNSKPNKNILYICEYKIKVIYNFDLSQEFFSHKSLNSLGDWDCSAWVGEGQNFSVSPACTCQPTQCTLSRSHGALQTCTGQEVHNTQERSSSTVHACTVHRSSSAHTQLHRSCKSWRLSLSKSIPSPVSRLSLSLNEFNSPNPT